MGDVLKQAIERARERQDGWRTEDEVREWKRRLWVDRIASMGLPKLLERAIVSGEDEHGNAFRASDTWRKLEDAASRRRFVVLSGNPGTGKTFAAAKWLSETDEGDTALWISSADYAAMAPWDPGRVAYRYCTVLVIDDLGIEAPRDRQKVEALLYERHAQGGKTVCTTNLGVDEFAKAYSSRVLSRLRESGAWKTCHEVVRPGEVQQQQLEGTE